jgi:DNA repair exonuclease SbcCD nuclease subunit
MKKIALIADLHIGNNRNPHELYTELEKSFYSVLKEENVEVIGVLGDLYDKKISNHSVYAMVANQFVFDLQKLGKFIFLIQGTYSHDVTNLLAQKHFISDNFRIYKTVTVDIVENMTFLIIPEEYEDNKEEYYKKYLNKKVDFVFGHGLFDFAGGWALNRGNRKNKVVFNTKDFKNSKNGAYFGHIHTRMMRDNCEYIGSFSRDSFGEEEPKGFLLITYDELKKEIIEKRFIVNELAPVFLTINANDLKEGKIFDNINNLLKNCYKLRIIIDSDIKEEVFNDIKAISYDNNRILVDKRMRGLSKSKEEVINKELEQKRLERRTLLDKYKNMSFYDITQSIAKEKYNTDLTKEEINSLIYN